MATTAQRPHCLICGNECRVMAYYGDKVCSQRCSEAKAAHTTERQALNGWHKEVGRHVDTR